MSGVLPIDEVGYTAGIQCSACWVNGTAGSALNMHRYAQHVQFLYIVLAEEIAGERL